MCTTELNLVLFLLSSLYHASQSAMNASAPSNDTDWIYECGPDFTACSGGVITCPTDANCEIICSGNSGCYNTVINWPINGSGTIQCNGPVHQSCAGVNFPAPPPNKDFTFECDTKNECGRADIYCPLNANCHIICNAETACADANIYWSNSNTKPIISTLTCNESFIDSCQNIDFPPTNSPTYEPTYQPTINPTSLPTILPTFYPTNYPSTNPTNLPTFQPTNLPTFQPTNLPTFQPTNSPTFQPTNLPTFYPSTNPTNMPSSQPTESPTIPTLHPTLAPTTIVSADDLNENEQKNNETNDNSSMVLVVTLLCGVILIVCIVSVLYFKTKNKNADNIKIIASSPTPVGTELSNITQPGSIDNGTTANTDIADAAKSDGDMDIILNDNEHQHESASNDEKGDNVGGTTKVQTEGMNATTTTPGGPMNATTTTSIDNNIFIGDDEFIVMEDDEQNNQHNDNLTTKGGTHHNDENITIDGEGLILRKDEEINRLKAQIKQLKQNPQRYYD